MKRIIFTLLGLITAIGINSCDKAPNEEVKVNTVALKKEAITLEVDASEALEVTVLPEDATDKTLNWSSDDETVVLVEDGVLTALAEGTVVITARSSANPSVKGYCTVTVVPAGTKPTGFYRKNLIQKFTATSCPFCPDMGDVIIETMNKNPDRMVEIAYHRSDQVSNEASEYMIALYGITGIPQVVVDYNEALLFGDRSTTILSKYVQQSVLENPTISGLKMDTKISDNNVVTVNVETTVEETNNYKISVALLVSGYNYKQSGREDDPSYKQNHVLHTFFQEDFMGEDLGVLEAGSKAAKTYTYDFSEIVDLPEGSAHTFEIVAFVFNKVENGEFWVNNVISCPLGEAVDYRYE